MNAKRCAVIVIAVICVAGFRIGSHGHVTGNTVQILNVDRDIQSNFQLDPQSPQLSITQFINQADKAAQMWNRSGRGAYALAVNVSEDMDIQSGNPPLCPPAYCSWCWWGWCPPECEEPPFSSGTNKNNQHDIIHRLHHWCDVGTMQTVCQPKPQAPWEMECDIIVWSQHEQWKTMHDLSDSDFEPDAGASPDAAMNVPRQRELEQNLAHEMGHVLGLGDLYTDPWDPLCDGTSEAPLMCSYSSTWDFPAPDDIAGVRAVYGLVYRDVRLLKGDINASGGVTWGDENFDQGLSSNIQPRLGCRAGSNTLPDCILASTGGGSCPGATDCVRLKAITLDGSGASWSGGAELILPYRTFAEVDVALGTDAQAYAVAVFYDPDSRRVRTVSWDPNNPSVYYTQFVDGNDFSRRPIEARDGPRIAYHAGANQYVLAFVDRRRVVRLTAAPASSAPVLAWAWAGWIGRATQYGLPPPNTFARRVIGPIDLVCPAHEQGGTAGSRASAAKKCHVMFSDWVDSAASQESSPVTLWNRNHYATVCQLQPPTNGSAIPAADVTCWIDTTRFASLVTSVSDYGVNPAGGYAGNAWLSSTGNKVPHYWSNTWMALTSNAASPFMGSDLAGSQFHIAAFGGAPPPSLWGGAACDFVEYGGRFLCAELKGQARW